MAKFGLIGRKISYSFSKTFFSIKFDLEKLDHTYSNFDIEKIEQLKTILEENPDIKGLNVTIPYKEAVLPFLDRIDKEAKNIGAVNTIKILSDGRLVGYNTDHYGFAKSLETFPLFEEKTALILGSGGASKAIKYVLETMNFDFKVVSREPEVGQLSYKSLSAEVMKKYKLIINTTPLGTHPNISECPNIPYSLITQSHFLYDLIYNPKETEFLKRGFAKGATICNGMKMLEYQAKKSWKIWNS
ncbi:MAG: shikimate dehydrogenase family protein [Patiriisocius sp.]|uniref:shikimate dehydrogenase family protein n=1 Tax=Patiriisocius sp. TaxID=2822396 RepID=UPI003EFA2629